MNGWRFNDIITISRIITCCTYQVQNTGHKRTVINGVTELNRNTTRLLQMEQRSNAVIMVKKDTMQT